jgi:hypothetical protein
MRPDLLEVLDSISWTFDTQIVPAVPPGIATSLSFTISNMLRHARLRAEREGESLAEDNQELRSLLDRIASYARGDAELKTEDELLADYPAPMGPAGYRGLAQVTEEATALRWRLQQAIERLQGVRDRCGAQPAYRRLREEIRAYLDHQLEREARWMDDAFTGPRR